MRLTFHIESLPNSAGHCEHLAMIVRTCRFIQARVIAANLSRMCEVVSPRNLRLFINHLVNHRVERLSVLKGIISTPSIAR